MTTLFRSATAKIWKSQAIPRAVNFEGVWGRSVGLVMRNAQSERHSSEEHPCLPPNRD